MMRVVIVDDQTIERFNMKVLFKHCPDVDVVGVSGTVDGAAELINRESPDAVFLDIEMGESTGFDLLPMLKVETDIVFVTMHNKYAIRAFEVNALDYLMKPVDLSRLQETLKRIGMRKDAVAQDGSLGKGRLSGQDIIHLKDKKRQALIPVDDIIAVSSDGDFSIVYTGSDVFHMFRRMKNWRALLPDPPFAVLDRTLIVNTGKLQVVTQIAQNKYEVRLLGMEEALLVGKTAGGRTKRIMKRLGGG